MMQSICMLSMVVAIFANKINNKHAKYDAIQKFYDRQRDLGKIAADERQYINSMELLTDLLDDNFELCEIFSDNSQECVYKNEFELLILDKWEGMWNDDIKYSANIYPSNNNNYISVKLEFSGTQKNGCKTSMESTDLIYFNEDGSKIIKLLTTSRKVNEDCPKRLLSQNGEIGSKRSLLCIICPTIPTKKPTQSNTRKPTPRPTAPTPRPTPKPTTPSTWGQCENDCQVVLECTVAGCWPDDPWGLNVIYGKSYCSNGNIVTVWCNGSNCSLCEVKSVVYKSSCACWPGDD